MNGRNTTVWGLFRDLAPVEHTVDKMLASGFRTKDVSVVLPDNAKARAVVEEGRTDTAAGQTAGAIGSSATGSSLRMLAGLGTRPVSGIGTFLAAGPVAGSLTGLSENRRSGFLGALLSIGIPEQDAERFESHIGDGAILVAASCEDPDWARLARNLLLEMGAEEVSSSTQTAGAPR
jgi:hypothetical protein